VRDSTWARAALPGLTAYLVHQYRYDGAAPFVYFQF